MAPLTSEVAGSERLIICSGRNYLVLAIDILLKEDESVRTRVRLVRMCPDFNELGSNLNEAEMFRQAHNQLSIQYNLRKNDVTSNASRDGNSNQWDEASWDEVTNIMEQRKSLLDNAIAFYASEKLFVEKLYELELNNQHVRPPINDEEAKQALQKHLELRKNAIESCMGVVRCSQSLFERLGTIRAGPHPTTAGCKAVELPLIQVKLKCQKLDELSLKHGYHLENCLTVAEFKQRYEELKMVIEEAETKYFGKELVGSSLEETQNNLREVNITEKKINNCIENIKSINSQLEILQVTATSDIIGQFKNEIEKLDSRCDHVVSIFTNRRRSLKLASKFYALAVEVEIELENLTRYSASEPERKSEFKDMADAKCLEILYVGHLLVSRIDADENKAAVEKLKLFETKLNSLKIDDSTENTSENSVKKIKLWIQKVGDQIFIRDCYLPEDLASINQFLVESKAISEEIKLKRTDLENILSAPQLEEQLKGIAEGSLKYTEELAKKFDWRSHSALSAIKLTKIHRQLLVRVKSIENFLYLSKKELNENSINQIEAITKKKKVPTATLR